jgi:hypothetical protein
VPKKQQATQGADTAKPVRLRYHQRTFDLLGEIPVVSQANLRLLTAWEKKHRVRLPVSLREWYMLEGAESRGHWTEHKPESLEPLLQFHSKLAKKSRVTLSKEFLLDFGEDETSTIVHFDRSGDPPVIHEYEGAPFEKSEKPLRFSEFMFRKVCEILVYEDSDRPVLRAVGGVFGPIELDFVSEKLTALYCETKFGGRRELVNPFDRTKTIKLYPYQHMFKHPTGLVEIWCHGDPRLETAESEWWLASPSKKSLFELAMMLWGCGDFSKTLRAVNNPGKTVLARLRQHIRKSAT